MDQSTTNIRLASWKTTIESCQARPEGMSVRQWLAENQIPEKQYYYWQRKVRRLAYDEISCSIPAMIARVLLLQKYLCLMMTLPASNIIERSNRWTQQ